MSKSRPEGMAEAISAFVKAAMLDMDYAISVYLETLDDARRRAEEAGREALQQERALVGESIGAALAKLASQDLTYRLSTEMPDAYRELQADFNAAIEKLEEVMQCERDRLGDPLRYAGDRRSSRRLVATHRTAGGEPRGNRGGAA
jgi:methyl-accepting chemotaxis protein